MKEKKKKREIVVTVNSAYSLKYFSKISSFIATVQIKLHITERATEQT